jgi:hypothetical protein
MMMIGEITPSLSSKVPAIYKGQKQTATDVCLANFVSTTD